MPGPESLIGQTFSHYRVVDKIGTGGMGVVYRAHDEQLDRDVALKVLPVGALADEETRRRFRREALALAKLNHPNIETVYEFATQDGMDFLAMELIPGQTLSEKLRHGPLAQRDVVRLAVQLSDGLTAAHEKGIIHRDLKPGNLIVTHEGRLKILDFGLAKLVQLEPAFDLTQSVTIDSGRVSGTLPYMSPEQLRGLPVDSRSDIFAAGAVLYELATGRRPFPQLQSAELVGAILHKTPDLPSLVNPEVSPALERVIFKALEKEPSNRYHTAREVRAALEGISTTSLGVHPWSSLHPPRSVAVAPPRRRSMWIIGVTGLTLILMAGLYLGLNLERIRGRLLEKKPSEGEVASPLPIKSRRSVAVLGFKNMSGRSDKAWVSTALSEMMTTELAAGEQLRTVSGEDVAGMKASLSLPDADSYGAETLRRIHKNLHTDLIVLGSYVVLGDGQVRLDLRLQDASQGVTLAFVSEKGGEDQIDDLVGKAGAALREKLGVGVVTPTEAVAIKATLPTTPEARRLYAEGIAKLRAFDNMAARDLLQKAVREDPNFALAHSALASAYSALGYDEKARQSARNAFQLSSRLSREDRVLVEARYREANKEWDHAIESYRVLFGFFPDNLEYGILLAGAQIHGGSAKEALNTIESLRRLPAPAREDPRIDLKEADAFLSLGDFAKARSSASSAAELARTNNAKLILADSLFLSAEASEYLNQAAQAMSAIEEAEAIYLAAGDRSGVARSLEVTANVLADKSDFPGAVSNYKKQLAIARDIGNRRLEASALNNMAIVLKNQGDPEGARKLWERALLSFRDISDKANSAAVLVNIGGVLLEGGDLVGAKNVYDQALSISQEINDQNGISTATAGLATVLDAQGELADAKKMLDEAIAIDLSGGLKSAPTDKLISLGDVLRHQGNLSPAKKTYQDALAKSREGGDKTNAAFALMGLGGVALDSADLKEARSNYDETLAIRTELGEKRNVAATQVALAELAIEEGRAPEAYGPVKNAIEQFRTLRSRDEEVAATVVLARALLSQGKAADAARELAPETALIAKSQNPALRIRFAIATARIEAASGNRASANVRLKTALDNATRLGFVGYQLECRLAMAEVAASAGKSRESRTKLNELEKDAREKGFKLIARRAAETANL
jgi:eukaryotic-like serine/threonine-protein kinase